MADPRPYRWVILVLAFLSQFAASLAVSVVPPLAPLLQSELGITKAEIGIFSSAAFAGSWCVLLAGGYWNERFGARLVMSTGLIGAGAIMLTMAFAGSFLQAVLVMVVVGLARGVVQPGASKSIMDWFAARERATAMGIKQTGYPIGGIILGAALPSLALALGWRSAIALVGVLTVLSGIAIALFFRAPPGQSSAAAAGIDLRKGFYQVLANRPLWVLSIIAVLLVTAQSGLAAYLALYFSDVVLVERVPGLNERIVAAGFFLAILQAGGVMGRIFWGLVSDRLLGGRRMPGLALVGAIATCMGMLLAFFGPTFPIPALVLLAFAYGGTALGWNGLYHAQAVESAGKARAAMGAGLSMTIMQIGTIGGPPLFGFIVDVSGSYQVAWIWMGLLTLAGTGIAAVRSRSESQALAGVAR